VNSTVHEPQHVDGVESRRKVRRDHRTRLSYEHPDHPSARRRRSINDSSFAAKKYG
jgi:hypothetical protein